MTWENTLNLSASGSSTLTWILQMGGSVVVALLSLALLVRRRRESANIAEPLQGAAAEP